MKVVIIGTGNVANVLGRKVKQSGNEVLQVVGRNLEEVSKLSLLLNAPKATDITQISPHGDIYILAVSDAALPSVADFLRVDKKIVVHTAATQSINILKLCSRHYGVVYPLQTLHKSVQHLPDIPFLIDGESQETIHQLHLFCTMLSDNVKTANDNERLKMHVAAVFANNFTNHIFALAHNYCIENNLDFDLLRPLIEETVNRAINNDPATIQTGPAVRNDVVTIEKHTNLLEKYPAMLHLYGHITKSIINSIGQRGS